MWSGYYESHEYILFITIFIFSHMNDDLYNDEIVDPDLVDFHPIDEDDDLLDDDDDLLKKKPILDDEIDPLLLELDDIDEPPLEELEDEDY
jgi:hypothetical protein